MTNDLDVIKARGRLVLVTRENAACYFQGPYGPAGFEYDLAKAFADHLEVDLEVITLDDEADMITALRGNAADIMAAGRPLGKKARRLVAFGPGYMEVNQLVIGRRGGPKINSLADLSEEKLSLTPNSAQLEILDELKSNGEVIDYEILPDKDIEAVLEMVWTQDLTLTLAESNLFKLNNRFYPELVSEFDLETPEQLAWAINSTSLNLQREVLNWFSEPATQEFIKGLKDYYYSHLDNFDYVDLARFHKRIDTRLPKYRSFFESAAATHDFDWQLIAAQAYQESHWNPRAVSFTGVRGIMMVTQETAKSLGLTNRLAAEEGIYAGTEYLARLHSQIDETISEPDRTFMALAAYNVGLGHLQDARELAVKLGRSDRTWHSIRSVLPLLQQKKHYKQLFYGFARGNEAVSYVDHIRTYYRILTTILDDTQNVGEQ